jgi:predicted nucleic acid-binding protein
VEGITFDTGALIALERRQRRMLVVWERATERALRITVPFVVVAEWWRGQDRRLGRILDAVQIEPGTRRLAETAGMALAAVGRGPSVVDAIVMASAAQRGDLVYTSDFADLARLQAHFPAVRILRV